MTNQRISPFGRLRRPAGLIRWSRRSYTTHGDTTCLSGASETERAFAIAGALGRISGLLDWIRWSTGPGVAERAAAAEDFWEWAAAEIE